jgi:hypothetical protein
LWATVLRTPPEMGPPSAIRIRSSVCSMFRASFGGSRARRCEDVSW